MTTTAIKVCRLCKALMTDKEPRWEICGACRLARRLHEEYRDFEDPEWFRLSLRQKQTALRLKGG